MQETRTTSTRVVTHWRRIVGLDGKTERVPTGTVVYDKGGRVRTIEVHPDGHGAYTVDDIIGYTASDKTWGQYTGDMRAPREDVAGDRTTYVTPASTSRGSFGEPHDGTPWLAIGAVGFPLLMAVVIYASNALK